MSEKPIAVFGATGVQGGPVVDRLRAAGRPVRAIARTPSKLSVLADRGAEILAVDLADSDAVTSALAGTSGAFIHLPFIPVPDVVRAHASSVVRAVEASDLASVVFTLSGPSPTSATGAATFDTKLLARDILSQVDSRLVGFEPTGYLDNLTAPFSAPAIVHEHVLRYPLPPTHRQPWISTDDQARLASQRSTDPTLPASGSASARRSQVRSWRRPSPQCAVTP